MTQNTQWERVEEAIDNLVEAGLLDPQAVIDADTAVLAEAIRPSGYYNTKTGYLKEVSRWFIDRDAAARELGTDELREELLSIRGVGPETADDILLYVYQRPVFIYDRYGLRLLEAAGFGTYANYNQAKKALDLEVDKAGFSAAELAHFHGLIVDAGKDARRLGGWDVAYPLLAAGEWAQAVGKRGQ
nr:hypothetical protein [Corynebacterium sp. TAE3-ERU12]